MQIIIGSEMRIIEASKEVNQWCSENLILPNPEYADRMRRGMWTKNTPKYLWLYRVDGSDLILPVGVGKQIRRFVHEGDAMETDLADNGKLTYNGKIPLYDYQEPAVAVMSHKSCGIIQSPCGSGKTQIGIALAAVLGRKTLWITHTQDLLNQSFERAAQYYGRSILGTITAGKVQIGSHITFATVQTLSKLDLSQYKYTWDVIIVDECHRLAGSPTQVSMFYKVMNSLAARYKYGLSATVHRSDGLIQSTFAVLGEVAYQVPDAAVADKTMKVRIVRRDTGIQVNRRCLDTDGTLEYSKLIPYLTESGQRNQLIAEDLIHNQEHFNLVLSDRLEHLRALRDMLPEKLRCLSSMIDGGMTSKKARAERIMAIEDMRTGKKRYLFATYSLAKEGLDIPRLDRLYMTTPKKDYAVVTQSIGRIARVFEGKAEAVCYDYADDIQFCQNQYKRRCTHYRKAGCVL